MEYELYEAYSRLLTAGKLFQTNTWQSTKNDQMFLEIINLNLSFAIPLNKHELEKELKFMSKPWAEDHFEERVSGLMLNPGEQYKNWPYFTEAKVNNTFKKTGQFSHTYMERMNAHPFMGIRFEAGNLQSVVNLLKKDPSTRQAYLPIFFPEDTGCVHGERIPCTLGYHFMVREGKMHMWYYARSIDAIYHFEDDIYLACRLCQWVIWATGLNVNPGNLNFHIANFHCFEGVKKELAKRYNSYV